MVHGRMKHRMLHVFGYLSTKKRRKFGTCTYYWLRLALEDIAHVAGRRCLLPANEAKELRLFDALRPERTKNTQSVAYMYQIM